MIADVGKTGAAISRSRADCKMMRGSIELDAPEPANRREALFRPEGPQARLASSSEAIGQQKRAPAAARNGLEIAGPTC